MFDTTPTASFYRNVWDEGGSNGQKKTNFLKHRSGNDGWKSVACKTALHVAAIASRLRLFMSPAALHCEIAASILQIWVTRWRNGSCFGSRASSLAQGQGTLVLDSARPGCRKHSSEAPQVSPQAPVQMSHGRCPTAGYAGFGKGSRI